MILNKEKLLKEKNWNLFMKCFDLDQQLDGFIRMKDYLNDEEYFHYLGIVLQCMNCHWKYPDKIRELIYDREKKYRHNLMNETDKEYFEMLPNIIEIYRGCREINMIGFSWSLSEDIARYFTSNRMVPTWELARLDWDLRKKYHNSKRILIKGLCRKENVLAHFTALGEAEILIDYHDVDIVETVFV